MIKILSFASTRNDKNNLPDNNDDVNYNKGFEQSE